MLGKNQSQNHSSVFNSLDELPKIVIRTLALGTVTTSMDFHPIHQTLLLGLFIVAFYGDYFKYSFLAVQQ